MDTTGLNAETTGSEVNNNIVDFVEKGLDIKLLDYQKEVLTKLYESYKNGEKLHIRMARGRTRTDWTFMAPLIFEKYEESKDDTRF